MHKLEPILSDTLFTVPYLTNLTETGVNETCFAWITQPKGVIRQQWVRLFSGQFQLINDRLKIAHTTIAASPEFLSFVTPDGVDIYRKSDQKHLSMLNLKGVEQLVFDADQNLWLLAGMTLYKAAPNIFQSYIAIQRAVYAFIIADGCLYTASQMDERGHLVLEVCDTRSKRLIRMLQHTVDKRTRISLQITGSYIAVLAQPRVHLGATASRLTVINICDGHQISDRMLEPIMHAGLRQLKIAAWANGTLLLQAELKDDLSLFHYDPKRNLMTRLSEKQQEVMDFTVHPATAAAYYIAFERRLNVLHRSLYRVISHNRGETRQKLAENVGTTLTVLHNGDCLFIGSNDKGLSVRRWRRNEKDTQILFHVASSVPPYVIPTICAELCIFKHALLNLIPEKTLILFIPGLHKPAASGVQPNFFQEGIYRILAALHDRGCQSLIVNLPGASGLGMRYRTQASLNDQSALVLGLRRITQCLRERGFGQVVLMSGSLGALSLLSFLQAEQQSFPSILVNPVYKVSAIFDAGHNDMDVSEVGFYPEIGGDMLIIHGTADEVAPWSESLIFSQVNDRRRLYSLESEGHIYSRGSSWQRCHLEISRFLDAVFSNPQGRVISNELGME